MTMVTFCAVSLALLHLWNLNRGISLLKVRVVHLLSQVNSRLDWLLHERALLISDPIEAYGKRRHAYLLCKLPQVVGSLTNGLCSCSANDNRWWIISKPIGLFRQSRLNNHESKRKYIEGLLFEFQSLILETALWGSFRIKTCPS